MPEQRGQRWICRKKRHIGHFHHFMADRRNGRLVAAIDDVREPIAVVLNEGVVAKRERAFRRDEHDRHENLREGHEQSRQQWPEYAWLGIYHDRFRKRRGDTKVFVMARLRALICICRLESHGFEKLDAGFCFQSKLGREDAGFIRRRVWPVVRRARPSTAAPRSSKLQAPSSKETPSTKHQGATSLFGAWNWGFLWCLELAAWGFRRFAPSM